MDQARPLTVATAQGAEHAVDVLDGSGPALNRKSHRLVEYENVIVLVKSDRGEEASCLLVRLRTNGLGPIKLERRNAHRLSNRKAILAVNAFAVDAHLAFADDTLDVGEREAGESGLEEPINAHARLVGGHRDRLHPRCQL